VHNFVLADAAVPVFDFGASTFAEVMKTITFIDKMMVIKAIFKATYRLLITALCKFDKSTNLAMIRHFVEIQLDEMESHGKTTGSLKTTSCLLKTS
jgi:hypothetical protein